MKKERPIIFSTPMVEAILEGRKTMTRRVIVPQPKSIMRHKDGSYSDLDRHITKQPRYDVGDVLWVRETSQEKSAMGEHCGHCRMCKKFKGKYIYRASFYHLGQEHSPCNYWKPSIHMKREAARIFLEVVSVRVERLRKITGEDKVAEGFCCCSRSYPCAEREQCEKPCFMKTWDSLNAKRGEYGWKDNPWVWVVEFRRVKKCSTYHWERLW